MIFDKYKLIKREGNGETERDYKKRVEVYLKFLIFKYGEKVSVSKTN